MERGTSEQNLSADDIAYRLALSSAKEKPHDEEGGYRSNAVIHQKELNQLKKEKGENDPRKNIDKGNENAFAMEGEVGEETPLNESTMNQSWNNNRESSEGIREGRGGGGIEESVGDSRSVPLGTGGGGGASSGLMDTSHSDITQRMAEMEAMERHPLPKLRDADHPPKAIASTFHHATHSPPSNTSGYRFSSVNEHVRKGGGKAPRSQKMIVQPGGKYGQRY